MSKESYTRGFVKAAQAMGADPVQLAKFAATNTVANLKQEYLGKPVSNPSMTDYMRLFSLDPRVVRNAVKGYTVGDYLGNMRNVDPNLADYWLGYLNLNVPDEKDKPLDEVGVWGRDGSWQPEINPADVVADSRNMSGHYANITNMLDRLGLWNPKLNRPTSAGAGVPENPFVSGAKINGSSPEGVEMKSTTNAAPAQVSAPAKK